ncbi:MAG: WW domain binding protein 4 [Alectoria sarmentosa]|nr:MAG: WW domain binding protein 4 [Alectoria sarmentosa]
MSEYWKSTPKYWCKHCKTFVRDTKLEKTNHEATPKHQGNLKRFLRDLHKGHERDERDKQRAKDEVDRLNGVISGSGSSSGGPPWEKKSAIPPLSTSGKQQATPADRKRQLAQLAEMGVAVPEDFRREMAMAGDWQTTSERVIYDNDFLKKEEDSEDVKFGGLNVGVRKRKFEGQEEEEEAGETVIRKGWGSTLRTYPGAGGDENDLDSLLKSTKRIIREGEGLQALGSVRSSRPEQADSQATTRGSQPALDVPAIKREESAGSGGVLDTIPDQAAAIEAPAVSLKQEENPPACGVIFKKRKAKQIRQK